MTSRSSGVEFFLSKGGFKAKATDIIRDAVFMIFSPRFGFTGSHWRWLKGHL